MLIIISPAVHTDQARKSAGIKVIFFLAAYTRLCVLDFWPRQYWEHTNVLHSGESRTSSTQHVHNIKICISHSAAAGCNKLEGDTTKQVIWSNQRYSLPNNGIPPKEGISGALTYFSHELVGHWSFHRRLSNYLCMTCFLLSSHTY